MVVLCQVVELVEADVYLTVVVFFDDHCACGEVAQPLAVLGQQDGQNADASGEEEVDRKEKPAQ